MKYFIILSIILTTSLISCKVFQKNDSKLPKNPKKIEILWEKNQGMMGGYQSIYLSNDSCTYKIRKRAQENLVKFTLSPEKLLALYNTFVVNKFSLIQTEKKEIYDRGGTKITLTVDGKSQTINNSGMHFVKSEFLDDYLTIEKKLTETAFEVINKQKKEIVIKLSDELVNSKYYLYLYINGKEVYNELNSGTYTPIKIKLLDSNNTFKITLMEKGSTYNTIKGNYEVSLEKLPSNNTITLTLIDNTLTIK